MEDLPFWMEMANQAGDPLLELGCGTGRILLPLANAGHTCLGLDHDPAMIAFIRQQAASLTHAPLLFVGDMVRFSLDLQFSLILLPCNTFSTLSEAEQRSCLDCVSDHLKPGGVFSFSIPNPRTLLSLPAGSDIELEEAFTHPQTGNPVQVSSSYHRTKKRFHLTWYYDELLPDGRVERITSPVVQYLLPPQAYLEKLRQAGMAVEAQYGDFDKSGYSPDSPYLICIASH